MFDEGVLSFIGPGSLDSLLTARQYTETGPMPWEIGQGIKVAASAV